MLKNNNSSFSQETIKLVVFDMDSTLIQIECIDEIADFIGIKEEVSQITNQAMQGEIDFFQALKKRVYLLKDTPAEVLRQVYDERLVLSQGAQELINYCQAHQISTAVVSGGFNYFTQRLSKELGINYNLANTLGIVNNKLDGTVVGEIIDSKKKQDYLIHLCQQLSLTPNQAIAVGDGANDLLMMKSAGVSVSFYGKESVRLYANYHIDNHGLEQVINLLQDH